MHRTGHQSLRYWEKCWLGCYLLPLGNLFILLTASHLPVLSFRITETATGLLSWGPYLLLCHVISPKLVLCCKQKQETSQGCQDCNKIQLLHCLQKNTWAGEACWTWIWTTKCSVCQSACITLLLLSHWLYLIIRLGSKVYFSFISTHHEVYTMKYLSVHRPWQLVS